METTEKRELLIAKIKELKLQLNYICCDKEMINKLQKVWGAFFELENEIKELLSTLPDDGEKAEEDIERLIFDKAQKYAISTKSPNREAHRRGFIAGYKATKQSNPVTPDEGEMSDESSEDNCWLGDGTKNIEK